MDKGLLLPLSCNTEGTGPAGKASLLRNSLTQGIKREYHPDFRYSEKLRTLFREVSKALDSRLEPRPDNG